MAMKIRRPRDLEEAEVIIIPMIDTMMFLLMVFIVASLTLAVQQGLPVNLPKASTSVTHPAVNVTLTLTAKGQLYLNTTPITLDQETAKLGDLKVADSTLVIINADGVVPYGTVVAVMDNARKAGVERFAMATKVT